MGFKFGKQEDGTWIIRENRLEELRHEVAKMVKRASKTATLPLELVEVERGLQTVLVDVVGGGTREAVRPWVRVRVDGETPRIAGFALVARVGHFGELGNIVNKAPRAQELELPEALRTAEPTCEHCATARKRKDTFVLRSEFGTLHQIGRNCLADFCRSVDVADALAMWRLLAAVECALGGCDEGEGGGGQREYTGTKHFLACAAKSIRTVGWVSRKDAEMYDRQSTAAAADFASGPIPQHPPSAAECWREAQPEDEDLELAAEVIDWAETLGEREELSDYLSNLRIAVAIGYIARKTAGIVASAISAYKREKEQEIKRARCAARGPGAHVGTVGKRQTFAELTVVRVRDISNDWGAKTIIALEDADGNELVWFATGYKEFEAGDVVSGKGTVKDHDEYQGRPQTVLTRCAFSKVEKEKAA